MIRRLLAFFYACVFSLFIPGAMAQVYVAIDGNDAQIGSADAPKATLRGALRQVRELRRLNDSSIKNGARILVKNGTYYLNESILIGPSDGGTATSPTIIEAAPNEHPVFSGGVQVKGWKKLSGSPKEIPGVAKGKLWVAELDVSKGQPTSFRQLWVNGQKAVRAKTGHGDSMSRILSWDKQTQTCLIPTKDLPGLHLTAGMEMLIHQWWATAVLRIQGIVIERDSARLTFRQPESRLQSEHPWPAPWISKETGNSAFYLMNALQFLDEPGEWFLDESERKLYYWPRSGEDPLTATVITPVLETLLSFQGTLDQPVSNIYITGLSFQHTSFPRPSLAGHVPLQAGMYLLDAYKLKVPGTIHNKGLDNQGWIGRPPAAVTLTNSTNISFRDCSFLHTASTALDFAKGAKNSSVTGCLLKDIGGTAINLGIFSEESVETHLPYNPTDERELCENLVISNNLITDATNEDWGCTGISAGYVRGVLIEHNELSELSYSGICVGWGWTKSLNAMRNNRVIANKIHHYAKHMYDVAGIYTLSAQPGTLISENSIDSIYKAPYAHLPEHWFYLYTDEGSSFMTVADNWCPSEKFLQNANGPGNTWTNNGPMVSPKIRNAAGLQEPYKKLFKNLAPHSAQPVKSNATNTSH
ncbi:MAG: right-handed parallel beta-helix repeat-containing protein [Bacteroidota bacterium]